MNSSLSNSSIISEINKVRTQPKLYSKKIENYLKNFEGNILKIPNKKNKLITLEGANGFEESIQFLNHQFPINKLETDINLSKAADAIAEQFSRTREMNYINQLNIHEIIKRYGISEGNIGISVDFGNDDIEMLIISLINDDGRRERKNRKMMFDEYYNKIGCSTKLSKYHKTVTVILYAVNFISNNELKNNYNFNTNKFGIINYVNEDMGGLDPKIDLFTDSAKMNYKDNYIRRNNYSETGSDCYNYDYPAGNIYKINKNEPSMKDVKKIEKNERFIFEDGKKIKIVMIKKYMENGEINTTVEKFIL